MKKATKKKGSDEGEGRSGPVDVAGKRRCKEREEDGG